MRRPCEGYIWTDCGSFFQSPTQGINDMRSTEGMAMTISTTCPIIVITFVHQIFPVLGFIFACLLYLTQIVKILKMIAFISCSSYTRVLSYKTKMHLSVQSDLNCVVYELGPQGEMLYMIFTFSNKYYENHKLMPISNKTNSTYSNLSYCIYQLYLQIK